MKEYKLKTKRPVVFHCVLLAVRFFLRVFFKVFFRLEVYGAEKIPLEKSLILCSNHISYADPVIIYACFPRIIFFMAKAEVFEVWLLKSFLRYFNTFPVNRAKFDRQAVRNSLEVLAENGVVGIFPEGTRSIDGVIRDAQRGTGIISLMSRSNILPVAISGTNKIIQKPHKRIFFKKIRLIFGDVIDTEKIIMGHDHKSASDIILKNTMEAIKHLYRQIDK